MVTGYAGSVSVSINESIDFYLSTDQPGLHHVLIQRWGTPGISLSLDWQEFIPTSTGVQCLGRLPMAG